MKRLPSTLVVALAFALLSPLLWANPGDGNAQDDRYIITSASFLNDHPDLRYRLWGLEAYRKERYADALRYFRMAARFADKPSQAMVAEIHWKGQGVAIDRGLAYAWMDLAAERGYPSLLAHREHYWSALTDAEKARALNVGVALYEDFGDAKAKPRLEAKLVAARRNVTGSRVGFVGTLVMEIPTPAGMRRIEGEQFYQDRFWKPELYWRWQDRDWKKPGAGRVDVGELQSVRTPALPDDADAADDDGGR